MDLGDKESKWVALNREDGELRDGTVTMTIEAITEWVLCAPRARVVMEAGTHAFWVADILKSQGHEPIVVPSDALVRTRRRGKNKNDERDSEALLELGRDMERKRVDQVWIRPAEYRADLALMKARDNLVRSRRVVAAGVRGLVKTIGERIGKHDVEGLAKCARKELRAETLKMVAPMLELIEQMNAQIAVYDGKVEEYLQRRQESKRLRQIKGVGPIITGGYLAIIGDPSRFEVSRDVPAYFGLAPLQRQSGESNPQLGISKAGSAYGRQLMVQGAQYILGPFGEDSDLRRWGLKLAGDGKNKARKRKAVIAVARKLAILLHRLWVTGEEYEPLRNANRQAARAATETPA